MQAETGQNSGLSEQTKGSAWNTEHAWHQDRQSAHPSVRPIGEGQTIEEERRSVEAKEGGARELQKP